MSSKKEETAVFIKTKDYLVTGESFELRLDTQRQLLYTHPQPNESELTKYYDSAEYISHTDSHSSWLDRVYQIVKKYALRKKVSLICSIQENKGHVLDIGAGTGDFLKAAKDKGWSVTGVEPNETARALSQKKDIELLKNLEAVTEKQFDVVTLWHVLEHLPDLETTVTKIESLVAPGGYLIIAVPNYRSYDAKYYGSFWAAYDTPRHLWHFSRDAMKMLFSEKMKLKNVRPMLFDSFYVSLLSEKYKRSDVFFLIRSFFIGLRSNIEAWRTKEYSSLIYCYQKSK
ncbi:class I SAM-dependent methyltransferase [Altibacter sp.]|uniref:class I SAM-dependent methyltransferase n=1 Tax=Altibacter sp. TaxID=2024823 RepID=UPI000C8C6CC0|nr:class I SAM-dependent methyltransferase [Altibacter sp.]MAP55667.1 methyltransferase [Altibacter sp.]